MTADTIFNSHEDKPKHQFDLANPDDDDDDYDGEEEPILSSSKIPRGTQQITSTNNNFETFDDDKLNKLYDHWLQWDDEIREFQTKHKTYVEKLDEVESMKTEYRNLYNKYFKKLTQLQQTVTELKQTYEEKGEETKKNLIHSSAINLKNSHSSTNLFKHGYSSFPPHLRPLTSVNSSPSLDKLVDILSPTERFNRISGRLTSNKLELQQISDTLPRKDPYLKVILGSVDVSILNKIDRWKYKEEYEKFKFIITCISFISSLFIWSLTSRYRVFDALFHFLLVWYYCTLTIRESILIVNGSHINPWWRAHHFISTLATGILLTWPESQSYHTFRTQFFVFSFYLSFVQGLQFYYQRGSLYRLRALGETHDMDITIEGFHRWMFRGLSFLVPFLLVAYLFQLYNAYTLWKLSYVSTTNEWQVFVLSIIFFILFLGNFLTTLSVLRDKLRDKLHEKTSGILLREKYQSFKTRLTQNYQRQKRSLNRLRYQHEQEFNNDQNIKKIS